MNDGVIKVVIMDNESSVLDSLKKTLESSEVPMDVRVFDNQEGVVEFVQMFAPDVVILDIEMDDDRLAGLGIAAELSLLNDYKSGQMHIIHVTGVDGYQTVYGEIAALASGSHDFMTKPVPSRLLLAKIMMKVNKKLELDPILYSDDRVIVEKDSRSIASDGTTWRPTNREFSVFETLIKNEGKVVSRNEILEHFERGGTNGQVASIVNKIRGYLPEDRAKTYIKTVQGRGYMFCKYGSSEDERQ